jgi:prolyl oligopeptidase
MRRSLLAVLILTAAACASTPPRQAPLPATVADPYRWLEEVDDPRALAWVKDQNERTRQELATTPGFEEMRAQALAALNSTSRIPSVAFIGNHLYNLWKDPSNPRGLYRRTTLDELRGSSPRWTTVLDIDELSRRENKPWVFKAMSCLPPANRLCLVSLSPGGGDAVEIREFDSETLRFIPNGFFLPEAKSTVSWIDENRWFVGTNFGAGTTTESGYPRVVKVWTRGTPLSAARTIYEGSASSVSASASRVRTEGGNIDLIDDSPTFWTNKLYRVSDLSTTTPLAVPETASLAGGIAGRLVFVLHEDWQTFKSGSVVVVDPARPDAAQLLVAPTASEIIELEGVSVSDRNILVPILENVRGRLDRFTLSPSGAWTRERIRFPDNGALSVMTTNDNTGDALVSFETFVDPPALYHVAAASTSPTIVMQMDPTFDGSRFDVTQQWALSKDGTRIPYFIVGPRGFKRDGTNPAHIFTYGGFRNVLSPSYSGSYEPHYGAYGKLWLERGGVFVLANIRGGGEFGPQWHSSVLKANRYKVFEDFEAVAQDLVRTGVTTSSRLGIEGRSNGGLLTLAVMNRHPELYGAVISGAPLSDMARYHEMLAGASWIDEYGDPRVPAEWEALRQYSPYQNFRSDVRYPPLLVYASTRDDRVHPGHARKTVARLLELGQPVWYFENVEGGHGGSATAEQLAYRIALSYAHLWRNLQR